MSPKMYHRMFRLSFWLERALNLAVLIAVSLLIYTVVILRML